MIDLPPQIETQIIEIAKQQNISIDEYVLLAVQEKLAQDKSQPSLDEMYEFLGLNLFTTGTHTITNDYVNELRERYDI